MHNGAQITGGATIAQQREEILRAVAIAENSGMSLRKACETVGTPAATVLRWRRAFAQEGLEGLIPHTANCGRKPKALLNEDEELLVKQLYIKTESKTSALRLFASSEHCRPEIADVILQRRRSKHTITRALRNQVELSMAVMDYHKSPTRVRHNAFINPRTLTYMDALGEERKILPGDLFERDDMSNNFLCWVPWPQGGDKCSDRFGVRVARGQNLIQIDVGSLYFISYNFLIRLRDSYRADDIWAWVQRSYQDTGMPRIGERWERGTWQSRKLRGDKDALMEAGHTGDEERLGGMAALGLKVITSQSPTTKIIENRFNFFQTICATIPGQIGRSRGEMERINKIWTQCREGHADPRKHFLSYDEVCDQIEAKLHFVNSEPVEGTVYHGIPAAIWAKAIAENPLQKVDSAKAYLFARDKASVTLNKCHAMVRFTRPDGSRDAWWFHRPDLYDYQGLKCSVYYDKYDVASGATIVITEGRHTGKVLGHAELISGCPQFALGEHDMVTDRDGINRKRGFMDSVRSEYRQILPDGKHGARVSSAEDGRGGRVKIHRGRTEKTESTEAEAQPARVREAFAGPTRTAREPVAETPIVNDRRRVKLNDNERLDHVRRLEESALRNGSILPV